MCHSFYICASLLVRSQEMEFLRQKVCAKLPFTRAVTICNPLILPWKKVPVSHLSPILCIICFIFATFKGETWYLNILLICVTESDPVRLSICFRIIYIFFSLHFFLDPLLTYIWTRSLFLLTYKSSIYV